MAQYVPVTPQTAVNAPASKFESLASVTSLSDGGFLIGYDESVSGSQKVFGQRFSSGGSPIGTRIDLSSPLPTVVGTSVTGLVGGGFVASFETAGGGLSKAQLHRYDAFGAPVGGVIAVAGSGLADDENYSVVTALTGGGYVVSWTSTLSLQVDVRAQVYNAAGTAIGGPFVVNTGLSGDQLDSAITALAGGGFVATWGDQPSSGVYRIEGQRFDSAGNKVGAEFAVPASVRDQTRADVASLATGGFVISWEENQSTTHQILAQRYDGAGAAVGVPVAVTAAGSTIVGDGTVAALPGGGFLVAWVEANASRIMARAFDVNGAPLDVAFQVNETNTGGPDLSNDSVTVLQSGAVEFVWTPDSSFGTFSGTVFARQFALQSGGPTQGDDNLVGGPTAEAINGLGGNDTITGGGGADALTGGPGFDTFRYTAASDSTSTAADAITDFTTGIDRLDLVGVTPTAISILQAGGASVVFVNTPGGAMQIGATGDVEPSDINTGGIGVVAQGGAASNVLSGSPFKDNLFGQDGNDLLIGRLGADVLFGGNGADVFYFTAAADSNSAASDLIADFQSVDAIDLSAVRPTAISIIQAGGNSLIFANTPGGAMQIGVLGTVQGGNVVTGGIGVVIQGGSASTFVIGSAGNDTLFGEVGNDVLIGGTGIDVLFGGAGFDLFKYQAAVESYAASPDLIADFETGIDKIDLRGTGITAIGIASNTVFGSGPGGITIQIGSINPIAVTDILLGAAPAPAPLFADAHTHGMDGSMF